MLDYGDFLIGDRVSAINGRIDSNEKIKPGSTGTVCNLDDGRKRIGVRWDINVGGHSCGKQCEHGYGWWAYPDDLLVIESPVDESFIASEAELLTMFGIASR